MDFKYTNNWTESASQLYRQIAPVAVPAPAEQMATLLALLPFGPGDSFRALEIGAGQGILSEALLDCFPRATVTALDGSPSMRASIRQRLQKHGNRGTVAAFELAETGWRHHLHNVDAVLSSLCLHHLSGQEKQALFAAVAGSLSPGGALLIADLVAPPRPEAQAVFAAGWDHLAESQSQRQTGDARLFDAFKRAQWNLFRYPDPDVDKPSPLFDQLLWLKQAGFAVVDCFWMQAGHAIYGGYKSAQSRASTPLDFEITLNIVGRLLNQ